MDATIEKKLKDVARGAWQYYGDDYMSSDEPGTACDVVECICDADRFETYASRGIIQTDYNINDEIIKSWKQLALKDRIRLVMEAHGFSKLKSNKCRNCHVGDRNKKCFWRETIGE